MLYLSYEKFFKPVL